MADGASPTNLREILAGWSAAEGPLYQRLAAGIRRAIDAGHLTPGTALPPERSLAAALVVSRRTVIGAYEDLKRTGYLEARQGSGTWVRGRLRQPDEGNVDLVEELEGHAIVRNISGPSGDLIEFTAASVDCAPEVNEALLSLEPAAVAQWSAGNGYAPQGLEQLRSVVAEHLERMGVPTTPEQVLITSGATQAIQLATRLFLEPGTSAIVETPSYGGALDAMHTAGARLFSIDVDEDGARTDQLADLLPRLMPGLVYLVPDMHNPTGRVLSHERRAEAALVAAESRVPVVEDLALRELWFDTPPPPPIASFFPDAPILTVGSMSKVFWGGLRVGWLRASEAVVARLSRLKVVADFGTPIVTQAVAAALLPAIEVTATWRRRDLQERLTALQIAGARLLPDWEFPRPCGGLAVWAKLPSASAEALALRGPTHGVSVAPGYAFAAERHHHADRVRIPIVEQPAVIEEGVRRLAQAWASVERERPRQPRDADVA